MDEHAREHAVEQDHGGYEHKEANARVVIYFFGSLALLLIVVQAVLVLGYGHLETLRGPDDLSQLALPRELPPQPRLQVAPGRDMSAYAKQENQQLAGKGAPGADPIEQAKQKILQEGLPSRPGGTRFLDPAGVPLESGGLSKVLPSHYLSLAGPGDLGNAYSGGEGPQTPPQGSRRPAHAGQLSPGEFGTPPVPSIKSDREKLGGANVQKRAR